MILRHKMTERATSEYKVIEIDTESSDENSDETYVDTSQNSVADIYIKTIKSLQNTQYHQLPLVDRTVEPHVVNPLDIQSYLEDVIARVDRLEQRTGEKLKNISDMLRQLNHAIQ